MQLILFSSVLFLSAALLFIIQPMVAKVLLPIYGGTPAVWTLCMLFFQGLLLIAYSYAWALSQLKGRYRWRIVHFMVCLLSLCVLPLALVSSSGQGAPEVTILSQLIMQVGLPLLVVSTSAPLLQFAYSQTEGRGAADPYFLYVASNTGSLLALLSYPWLVERYLGLKQQFYVWNIVYLVYLIVLLYLFVSIRYQPPLTPVREKFVKLSWNRPVYWVFLSFIPCSLMLGVTFYISTDVAATPLFWILPLALYLLSFVVTFAKKPIISHDWVVRNTLLFILFPILGFIIGPSQIAAVPLIIINLAGFFMLALLCHGELVQQRPDAHYLTTFYFYLALGGMLAGVFNGILAPRIFAHVYEYPLALWLALLCLPFRKPPERNHAWGKWIMPGLLLGILYVNFLCHDCAWMVILQRYYVVPIGVLCAILVWRGSVKRLFVNLGILFAFVFLPWFDPTQVLSQQRNFYGVKQVFSKLGTHVLMSQTTLHGFQPQQGLHRTDGGLAYYGPVVPVVERLKGLHRPLKAMVLGLGTGIMSCQFRDEDNLTLVEVDQQVIDIASDPKLFTYLQQCSPNALLIKADGRLAVARAEDKAYQLLVLDAFNSDSIPVHLLTLEAFTLYQTKLTPDGIILVNISNRHLRVLPVLTGVGRELDMIVLNKLQPSNGQFGQLGSEWALLTKNERLATDLTGKLGWRFVTESDVQVWTDDYSNIVPLLK